MLVVSPDHSAINLDHVLTLFIQDDGCGKFFIESLTPLAMHEQGLPTDVAEFSSAPVAEKVFDQIINAYKRGDKVFYVPEKYSAAK